MEKREKKLKSNKPDMLRGTGKQSEESVESALKRKGRLRLEGFAEKEGEGWWMMRVVSDAA